jgi:iron-sulfur cluster assembly protein
MLAMTPNATEAVSAILAQDEVPDGAGLRISPVQGPNSEGTVVGASVVETPSGSDQVIEDGAARVFVAEELSEPLGDKVLDADLGGERIEFAFRQQEGDAGEQEA